MSKFSRLPSLVISCMQADWDPGTPADPPEPDDKIPLLYNQNVSKPPFRAHFQGGLIHDHSYAIRAEALKVFPKPCSLLIIDWSLSYMQEAPSLSSLIQDPSCFTLVILSAQVIPDITGFKSAFFIAIDSNPAVFWSLKRFKFNKIRRGFEKSEEESQRTENSELLVNRLEQIVENIEKSSKSARGTQRSGLSVVHEEKEFASFGHSKCSDPINAQVECNKNVLEQCSRLQVLLENLDPEEIIETEETRAESHSKASQQLKTGKSGQLETSKPFTPVLKVKIKENLAVEKFSKHALEILKQEFGVI